MRFLVTGAAGFIGSTLSGALTAAGHQVIGLDVLSDYYPVTQKRRNLADLEDDYNFSFVEGDLLRVNLGAVLEAVDGVFHQAAQPGVRASWDDFGSYVDANVLATQRLLAEVAKRPGPPIGFVYASSSSIYGQASRYPVQEADLPNPHSPYGATKLAGEHLCRSYAENFGIHVSILRYFTVYGPRQRPDMAIHRLIEAARHGTPFPLFGDGSAVRDFTFVDDIVDANIAAMERLDETPTTVNVGGGAEIEMKTLVDLVGDLVGKPVVLDRRPPVPGDVARTGAAIEAARALLGYSPRVKIEEGLRRQIEWHTRVDRLAH